MQNCKLIMTVEEMQDRDKWLEMRNGGIGGSDAATIMGLNPWKSALELWMEKTGQREPADLSKNQRVYWGTKNEANIADWFTETTGKKVMRRGMMQNSDYPFMLASVDREVVGEDAGLEIKTAGVDQAKKWRVDDEGKIVEMPDAYYLQTQFYMAVTGCSKWYIAVLIGGNEALWGTVERNEEQIALLIEEAKKFWGMVQNNIMPDPDGSKGAAIALQEIYPGNGKPDVSITLDESEASMILTSLKDLKEEKEKLEDAIKLRENQIKALMGDYEMAYIGENKITWKMQAGRTTIDSKKLKKEMPDVYKKYAKTGKPVRVLRT